MLAQHLPSIHAVGVGICGPVDCTIGKLITSPILIGWENVSIADILTEKLKVPVVVDNDANMAILGESWMGSAAGAKNVVGLTLGTGIGGAIIINGEIYRGTHYFGGELGHMTIRHDGRPCPCGNRGCLTVEGAAQGVVEYYTNLCARGAQANTNSTSLESIFLKAQAGDPIALRSIEPMTEAIGLGIANIVNIFDPEFVVIAGGPTNSGEWFKDILVQKSQKHVFSFLKGQTPLVFATLGEVAGAIGASYLAMKVYP